MVPHLVIQLEGAALVMQAMAGLPRGAGAALVYGVVWIYILRAGVRDVGWSNVMQGLARVAVVWFLGLQIPRLLFGGVTEIFDNVLRQQPGRLRLPGPGPISFARYSSELLVIDLGFSMWPWLFMKVFAARNAHLVQLSAGSSRASCSSSCRSSCAATARG